MYSLDSKSIIISLKVFLSEYVCQLDSYDPVHIDILNQLSDVSKSLFKINFQFDRKKREFKRKMKYINDNKCYLCEAVGVYNMYNFKCDKCNEKYGRENA